MAGLMSSSRMMTVAALALMLAWPHVAEAGWFVRGNQIAYRLSQQGHDKQALAYWDHSAKGCYGRGTTLMHLGRAREAEQAFREALAVAPHKTGFSDQLDMPLNRRPHFMASVWYNLGNALYAQGELLAARDAWLKALDFEPNHAKARHNLKIVDRLLGARERAAQPPPAGLTGKGKHKKKPGKTGSQAPSPPQSQQHASLPLQLPGRSHVSSSQATAQKGGDKHAGSAAGGSSQPGATHLALRHSQAAGQGSTGSGDQGQSPESGQGMSRREAVQQLRLVEEGVSVFLRHRLGEKGRGSANGGKPW